MRFTIECSHNSRIPASFASVARGYDPELMIVECARCGRPVLWESGRSTEVLAGVGIDPLELDAHCLLLTDGCPNCRPRRQEGFSVQVFRLTSEQGGAFGAKAAGNA
ncbi:MAG: hypothetical protein LBC79_03575 [Deltaproteobacteria bacterium]|nr:hypothetical protein [Deltaproteobacteria bacterium]